MDRANYLVIDITGVITATLELIREGRLTVDKSGGFKFCKGDFCVTFAPIDDSYLAVAIGAAYCPKDVDKLKTAERPISLAADLCNVLLKVMAWHGVVAFNTEYAFRTGTGFMDLVVISAANLAMGEVIFWLPRHDSGRVEYYEHKPAVAEALARLWSAVMLSKSLS